MERAKKEDEDDEERREKKNEQQTNKAKMKRNKTKSNNGEEYIIMCGKIIWLNAIHMYAMRCEKECEPSARALPFSHTC